MKNDRQMIGKLEKLFYPIILLLLLNFSACSNDGLPICVNPMDLLIRINVLTPKDEDITSAGLVKEINLYLFDSNKQFLQAMTIPGDSLINITSIRLNNNINDNFWIIGWGNLNNNPTKALTKSMSISDVVIQLNKDSAGYAIEPNDLFFGIKQVTKASLADTTKDYINLSLKRNTALMNIAVKGLDPQYNDYHFVVSGASKDGYTLEGDLVGNPVEYYSTGAFNSTKTFFVTTNPFKVLSIPPGTFNTISIYRGSKLIASTHTNDNTEKNIVPIIGVTNNIFIDLTKGGESPSIEVIATDWNIIYHNFDW